MLEGSVTIVTVLQHKFLIAVASHALAAARIIVLKRVQPRISGILTLCRADLDTCTQLHGSDCIAGMLDDARLVSTAHMQPL